MECVVRNNDFYVFEMQFRLGGMRHYTFVQEENKIDTLEMHIRYALTGKFEGYNLSELDTPYYKKTYCSLNLLLKDGIITNVEGLEILDTLSEVKSYLPMRKLGDKVELSGTVFQIFMKASIVAESYKDLVRILKTIQTNISVKDENGEEIKFNSMVDAANYMVDRGWIFQQAYSSVYGSNVVLHWIFYKNAKNFEEARKGIITKDEYKKRK